MSTGGHHQAMGAIERTPFLRGTLQVYQIKDGYRFGIDAVLLANFVELQRGDLVLEVGAGQGVVSFILALNHKDCTIFALEREYLYIQCLQLGVVENGLQGRVLPVRGDFREPCFLPNSLDVIVANPPYFESGRGRSSAEYLAEVARRDKALPLSLLLKGAKALLKTKGKLYLIFTAFRCSELMNKLYQEKLTPKALRFVHSYPGDNARFVMVKAQKGAGEEVRVLPPLFLYETKGGNYTKEVRKWLNLE